ncbi:MAG: 1,6-anhydro-N-acetylmuramyl-L-alanine amidase AmpD [Aestuariibacter sp.]
MKIINGWLDAAQQRPCPHFDQRPDNTDISLLVVHDISLPPGEFGKGYVPQFFAGNLPTQEHPFFQEIAELRVSAHCFIDRQGQVMQFVSFHDRAWHAGVSVFQGVTRCNDFSIGIEMEGTDEIPYTDAQYSALTSLTDCLRCYFPKITMGRIVGHCDIAPGRKTDPGVAFDWARFRSALDTFSIKD